MYTLFTVALEQLNLKADNSRAAETAVVESDKSICSRCSGVEGEKTRPAEIKQEPNVKFKWASLKLRSMQHISKLPPFSGDSTRSYVTYKLADGEAA